MKEKTKDLFLILKKPWFEKINSGEKTHEYREVKDYWTNRLEGRNYETVTFQLGMNKNKRLKFEVKSISINHNPNNDLGIVPVYDISLGRRIENPVYPLLKEDGKGQNCNILI